MDEELLIILDIALHVVVIYPLTIQCEIQKISVIGSKSVSSTAVVTPDWWTENVTIWYPKSLKHR